MTDSGVTICVDGNPRFVDSPGTANTGVLGDSIEETVDLGDLEIHGEACYTCHERSTSAGVLDLFDFLWFQNAFVGRCP